MSGTPAARAIAPRASATSIACAADSIWHGPAMSTKGRWLPIATSPTATVRRSDKARLLHRRLDEPGEERVRREGLRFQLGMVLHADEPGVVGILDRLGQHAVGREAGEHHARALERLAEMDVDLVAVAVTLADLRRIVIEPADQRVLAEHRGIGAEPHRAAEIAAFGAALDLVAPRPFGEQPHHRRGARAEFRARRLGQPREIARAFDHRHLHPEADAEERHLALARELHRGDLPLGAALAEAAGHEDAVHAFE